MGSSGVSFGYLVIISAHNKGRSMEPAGSSMLRSSTPARCPCWKQQGQPDTERNGACCVGSCLANCRVVISLEPEETSSLGVPLHCCKALMELSQFLSTTLDSNSSQIVKCCCSNRGLATSHLLFDVQLVNRADTWYNEIVTSWTCIDMYCKYTTVASEPTYYLCSQFISNHSYWTLLNLLLGREVGFSRRIPGWLGLGPAGQVHHHFADGKGTAKEEQR